MFLCAILCMCNFNNTQTNKNKSISCWFSFDKFIAFLVLKREKKIFARHDRKIICESVSLLFYSILNVLRKKKIKLGFALFILCISRRGFISAQSVPHLISDSLDHTTLDIKTIQEPKMHTKYEI